MHSDRGKHNQCARRAEQKTGDQPPPSFTRQDAFDGASFAEYQNNQRQTDPYQQGRTHQVGGEYLPWETLTFRRFARL